jgi:integrase
MPRSTSTLTVFRLRSLAAFLLILLFFSPFAGATIFNLGDGLKADFTVAPAAISDLRGALKPPVRTHQAYIKENELPEYLKKLEAYDGALQTKLALKLLLLTFVRTTELRAAKWEEVNFEKSEWRIPPERMKMKALHIVPLARQAIAVLKEVKKLTGQRDYVFPNLHKLSGCMSANTMIFALYRMGYHSKATGHGFRRRPLLLLCGVWRGLLFALRFLLLLVLLPHGVLDRLKTFVWGRVLPGMAYTFGDGVPKDAAEAMKWFRKAAEQGNADAQYGIPTAKL